MKSFLGWTMITILVFMGFLLTWIFVLPSSKKDIAINNQELVAITKQYEECTSTLVAGNAIRLTKISKKIGLLQPSLDTDTKLEYATYIEHCVSKWGLEDNLIISMIQLESGFKPDAKSSAGAIGLMQIIPKVWGKEMDVNEEKLLDPAINIWTGCKILYGLKTKFPNDYLDRYGGFEPGSGIYFGKLTKSLKKIAWL